MEFTQEAFNYLDNITKDLTEELLDWKSCPEANTVRNILGHLLLEWYVVLPKILSGETVLPDEEESVLRERLLVRGFVGVEEKSLEEIKIDLTEGKKYVFSELGKIPDEDLAKELEWYRGKQTVSHYLMNIFVKEILHHEGQIAAILGVKKRIKEKL
jgi:hypothetical protein